MNTFEFDRYTFRQDIGLVCDDRPVPVPPKELQLLSYLLRKHDGLVTHWDIESEIWPDQEVAYSSIPRVIHSLRRILGGDRNDFIETVPKKGYRMGVSVRVLSSRSSSTLQAQFANTDSVTFANFLEGQREAHRVTYEGQARAASLFEKAHSSDPSFAAAAAALAQVRMYQVMRGFLAPKDALRLATAACNAALAIDPDHVAAACTSAWFDGLVNRNLDRALDAIDRAMQIDPEHSHGEVCRSMVYRALGRVSDAVVASRRACALDPHAITNTHGLAWSLFCSGRAAEAAELERTAVAELPHIDVGYCLLAVFSAWIREYDEADRACDTLVKMHSSIPMTMNFVAYSWALMGKTLEAVTLAEELEAAKMPRALRSHLAAVYVAIGDEHRALALLREARDERCPFLMGSRSDPRFGNLAKSREFRSLLE